MAVAAPVGHGSGLAGLLADQNARNLVVTGHPRGLDAPRLGWYGVWTSVAHV